MEESKLAVLQASERELNKILQNIARKVEETQSRAVLQHLPARAAGVFDYFNTKLVTGVSWLLTSRETTNYTYEITPLNAKYIASTIAAVSGLAIAETLKYVAEIQQDQQLSQHVVTLSGDSDVSDIVASYGRRICWYCFARALKPTTIIETGVEKGLGSVVLCAALLRNKAEGFQGRYYGTDINPEAGRLFKGPYSEVGEIVYGDSLASLAKIPGPIDLFINDSDHSSSYETQEYKAISSKLRTRSVILGDNSHGSESLWQFAAETGRRFLFVNEVPVNHWYPGAGIGIAY